MLPVFKGAFKLISCGEGGYEDCCSDCQYYKNPCSGCGNFRQGCFQCHCTRECHDCGGGKLAFTGAKVPAICCKSPIRDIYMAQVEQGYFEFQPQELIELESRAIVINQGSPGRYRQGCPYPDDAELIAVNLRHVWSTRGWFSHDMKDYLQLPSGAKLLLLTAVYDTVLERAWEFEAQYSDFASLGFDYWTGLEFSNYGDMGRLNNLWQSYRTLRSVEAGNAHFSAYPPAEMFEFVNGDPEVYQLWTACTEAIPQVTINWQAVTLKSPDIFKVHLVNLKRVLRYFPGIQAVWFIGVVSAEVAYNLQRLLPNITCYFLSVNPWLAAHKGDAFLPTGRLKKSDIPRLELVLQNQQNYANLINEAVAAALC